MKNIIFIVMLMVYTSAYTQNVITFDTTYYRYDKNYNFYKLNNAIKNFTKRDKIYNIAKFISIFIEYKKHPTLLPNEHDRVIQTIKTHNGMCQDNSELMNFICKQNNIKSETVHGCVKILQGNDIVFGTHAWNIVDDSMIIDVTFMQNFFDYQNPYNMWFDIDPTIASYNYFPLTPESISMFYKEFDMLNATKHNNIYEIYKSGIYHKTLIDDKQKTLTKKRITFELFASLPVITPNMKIDTYALLDLEPIKKVDYKYEYVFLPKLQKFKSITFRDDMIK